MEQRRGRSRDGSRPRPGAGRRAAYRHPVFGGQARRDNRYGPYVVGFVVVVLALAAFLYIGLNWATGPGRLAALTVAPTPTPLPVASPTPPPAPSPTPVEQVYVVKAGDSPASIARQFNVKTEDLMAANNIADPQRLQVGQTLKIPTPASR